MRKTLLLLGALALGFGASAGEVRMNKIAYAGWPNCVALSNGNVELVVTTDVGPRIIRFGFVGKRNLFKEYPDLVGKTGGDEWRIYGGHRLWHAPEAKPRTYSPDNAPVAYAWDGKTLKITQPKEADTGIAKSLEITLDADANHVQVLHRLVNEGPWPVELAPWALTVMAPGGRAIFPQEPFRAHTEYLLPARPMVLWHYTNMSDARWTWGEKYVQLRQDPKAKTPQKAGFRNAQGWLAYLLKGDVFLKRFNLVSGADYPDFGCNMETFTNGDMLELESLGPLSTLAPNGGTAIHFEHWFLFKADVGDKESNIDAKLLPLVRKTDSVVAP